MRKPLYLVALGLAVCGIAVYAEQSVPASSSQISEALYAYSSSDEEYSSNEDPDLKSEEELSSMIHKKSTEQHSWFSPSLGEIRGSH